MKNHVLEDRRFVDAPVRIPAVVILYTCIFFAVLPALLWAIGGRLDVLFALPHLGGGWDRLGVMVVSVGAAWTAWSMLWLSWRGSGLPISHLPPARLVSRGPYALIRHPIYLGYTVAFAGAGLAAGSPGRAFGASALLTVGWLLYVSGFEEPRLVRRYGDAYRSFRHATPLLADLLPASVRARLIDAWRQLRLPVERVANRTVLFRWGPTLWVSYGAWLAVGAAVMAVGLAGLLTEAGVSSSLTAIYVVGLAAAMLVCGRLMWLVYNVRALLDGFATTLGRVGFVSWGGYLGMFGFGLWFARLAGLDSLWLLDRTLLCALAASAFGRLGCLSYGCCYGRATAGGIRWTNPDAKVVREHGADGAVPRVPTPLLSAVHAFGVMTILVALTYLPIPSGTVMAVGLLLYALGRFAIDCLRDEQRYGSWGLTAGQIGSALAAGIGITLLFTVGGGSVWQSPATTLSLSFGPIVWTAVAAAVVAVFVVCGFHWREVGRW